MTTDEKLKECILLAADYYRSLEAAKDDCASQVDAALSLYVSQSARRVSKLDKKIIAKIAKAIATDKTGALRAEIESFVNILNSSQIEGGIQLSIFGLIDDVTIQNVSQ